MRSRVPGLSQFLMPLMAIAISASTVAAQAGPQGAPAAIAQFFDATKIDSKCPNDTTCVYMETFLTGATREITLTVSPGSRNPAGRVTPGESPISDFKFNWKTDPDSSVRINMSYYVANAGLPRGAARAQAPWLRSNDPPGRSLVRLASLGTNEPPGFMRMLRAAADAGGAGIKLSEIGKSAKNALGPAMGPLSTIYGLASAVTDVSAALDLGRQNRTWLAELDALEKCAESPTNRVANSDPSYSSRTVAMLQAARSELKEVNAVRFLNQMTKKAASLTPVTSAMGVGLKHGFAWSDQTLGDYSENTIMREARVAVVKCGDPGNASGNLDLTAVQQTTPNDITTTHVTANVSWEWQVGVKYLPRGTYNFSSIRKVGECTETISATGSIDDSGYLFVFDQARTKELGHGYEARFVRWPGTLTLTRSPSKCGISGVINNEVPTPPQMEGYLGTGGAIEGEMSPVPGYGGNSKLKWSFSVAAPKR
jgi:hypothetical protein